MTLYSKTKFITHLPTYVFQVYPTTNACGLDDQFIVMIQIPEEQQHMKHLKYKYYNIPGNSLDRP